uniref:U24-Saltitoxin-Pre1a_1 n=1 Tax=Phidippus regius TaxID=1905328 RepID=A0A482Z508_9ARAC
MKLILLLLCLLPQVQNSDLIPEFQELVEEIILEPEEEPEVARKEKCLFKRDEQCKKTCDCCGPWDICECTVEFLLGKSYCYCVKGELLNCNFKKKECPAGKRPKSCPSHVD